MQTGTTLGDRIDAGAPEVCPLRKASFGAPFDRRMDVPLVPAGSRDTGVTTTMLGGARIKVTSCSRGS
jgi:hypothetical protein